jgi:transcriptional regulator with XRE-family HTH domain
VVEDPGPSVWLRQVGVELRRYRLAARKTAQQAGAHIGCSHSKISKIESAALRVKTDELRRLLAFYGVADTAVASLIEINEQPAERPWWQPYRDAIPDWFRRYASLEASAAELRTYETECVPGLMQTKAYARAMLLAWEPDMGEQMVKKPVELRLARQKVLTREDPLHFVAVVSEAALRKVVGSRDIMRGQMIRLLEVSDLPNVDLHVLTFDAPQHPVQGTSFSLLSFPDQDDAVIYLEDVAGATYLETSPEVGRYNLVFNRLRRAALDVDRSREFIDRVMGEYA